VTSTGISKSVWFASGGTSDLSLGAVTHCFKEEFDIEEPLRFYYSLVDQNASWQLLKNVNTACPAHSLLCRVDFTRFENDSGAEQYVLAETEAFRIKSLALAPDSTSEGSDSSSDGVEDDCAINVAQVQAT